MSKAPTAPPLNEFENTPEEEGKAGVISEEDVADLQKKIETKRIEKKFIILALFLICAAIVGNAFLFKFEVWSSPLAFVALQGLAIFILAKWFDIKWFDDIINKYLGNKK